MTGANGMLARAVQKQCKNIGDEVIGLTRAELDISDREAVTRAARDLRPDALLNCAAYTNVDAAETDAESCFAANAEGVHNLALASRAANAVFVTVSTDYVFDGANPGFYTQRDTPNPRGVYARAKREGEVRAFEAYPRSIIVRSGWIFGHGGTNFLSVMADLLADGKPITAIGDSFGTPTFADDLAARMRELAAADLPGVYHVTNAGEGCSYYDFALKVCEIAGSNVQLVKAASYVELNRPAPRPVSSKLACLVSEKLGFEPLPAWEDGLARFL